MQVYRWVHLRYRLDPSKTWCDRVIWEAIKVTDNLSEVTCPECVQENAGEQTMSGSMLETMAA
jgi:hypothetical protein